MHIELEQAQGPSIFRIALIPQHTRAEVTQHAQNGRINVFYKISGL